MSATLTPTTSVQPGTYGFPVKLKKRYDNYIGGQLGRPRHRPVLRERHPRHRPGALRDRPLHRRRHRARRSTPPTPPRRQWGKTSPAERARMLEKIAERMEDNLETARHRRDLGQRQAHPRDHGRRPAARDRPLPLLRRLHPRPGRLHRRDRRDHRRLPLPRAARRRRPDHPVELPHPDGHLEARARARRRQLRRAQAGRADAAVDPRASWS